MEFEWHPDNAQKSLRKHGVGFDDAVRVFWDTHRIEPFDRREAYGDDR